MHIVTITLNNVKTNKSETTQHKFYSIYNAERFVFEEQDIKEVKWPYRKQVTLKQA